MTEIRLIKKDKNIQITNKDGSIRVVREDKSVKVVNRKENIRLKHSGVGPAGVGIPAGGNTLQILAKKSNAPYDFQWEDQTSAIITSVNGKIGAVVLDKVDVGLGNVDNTSDASKPVSTAVQTALDAKADDADVVHNTGNETIAGNKTLTGTIVASNLSGTNTGDQDLSDYVTLDGVETLTNKTLTAPVINNPTGFLTGAAKITVGTSAPSSPTIGDLWVDTN